MRDASHRRAGYVMSRASTCSPSMAPVCVAVLIRRSRSQGRGVTPEGRRFEAQVPDPLRRSRTLLEASPPPRDGSRVVSVGCHSDGPLSAVLDGGLKALQRLTTATREESLAA